ncbi:MAG TPA: hypothetical protein VNB22_08040 [Pyrinomonadaceae bacterium]|jgi:hypothetical protein|nr:hypothetical protein [Pyrinomonadaceae bacterium]
MPLPHRLRTLPFDDQEPAPDRIPGGQGSQQVNFQWGINGDEPVPDYFDGDGKVAFCRAAQFKWQMEYMQKRYGRRIPAKE